MRLEYISEQNIASNSRWKVNRIFLFTEGKSSFSGGKLRWEKGKEPQIIPWPSESVGGPPFVLRSLFLSLFLWKRGIKKKKDFGRRQNWSTGKEKHTSPMRPPRLLQTGDYGEAYGKPDGTQRNTSKYCFKMKESRTRRLTWSISKHMQALGSWTCISGQSNLFKDANCSQTQKTVGFCLSFHKGCKLLIRLHCWAGHFVYQ